MEPITCILNRIRWKDYDSSRMIGEFQDSKDGKPFVALGTIFDASAGLTYVLHGDWVNNSKWGRQLQIVNYEVVYPKSSDGIYGYIVRIARWVGPKVGRKIIEKYGADALEVLRTEPERVAREIKGITTLRAHEIQEELQNNIDAEKTLVELERMLGGMGFKNLPDKAFEKWKIMAPGKIKENPYILTEIRGVGFPTADQIAMQRLGIEKDDPHRQVAYIAYEIKKNAMDNGDLWIDRQDLLNRSLNILGIMATEGLGMMLSDNRCIQESNLITLGKFYNDETWITRKIDELTGEEWI